MTIDPADLSVVTLIMIASQPPNSTWDEGASKVELLERAGEPIYNQLTNFTEINAFD